MQQSLENEVLDDAHWPPGLENPAGGATKKQSDMEPSVPPLESGARHPGILRPLKGAPSNEQAENYA